MKMYKEDGWHYSLCLAIQDRWRLSGFCQILSRLGLHQFLQSLSLAWVLLLTNLLSWLRLPCWRVGRMSRCCQLKVGKKRNANSYLSVKFMGRTRLKFSLSLRLRVDNSSVLKMDLISVSYSLLICKTMKSSYTMKQSFDYELKKEANVTDFHSLPAWYWWIFV